MSEPGTDTGRRFVLPADYYSGPSPQAVLPRGLTFGCGAAALVTLILVFAGGIWAAAGGIIHIMDFAMGMNMGEVRELFTPQVTDRQKKELDEAVESLRRNLRTEKVPVANLQPLAEMMRKAVGDRKITPAEVDALTATARKANRPARP
jgi:hypothetical protein